MAANPADLTQLGRGVLEYCVLALLEREERYGYDLVTELSRAGLVASEGNVYPLPPRRGRLTPSDGPPAGWRRPLWLGGAS